MPVVKQNTETSKKPKKEAQNYRLPTYEKSLPKWQLTEDFCQGQDAVEEKGEQYLPAPVPLKIDNSPENKARYEAYVKRAIFYGVTGNTLRGLTGEVYRKDPTFESSNEALTAPIVANIDGSGVTLDQQSKKTLGEVLKKGRSFLFADFPVSEKGLTVQQQEEGGIRPVIVRYNAEQVINWRTTAVGSENRLSLVMIVEEHTTKDDGYEPQTEARWKELKLEKTESGLVFVVKHWLWDENKQDFYQDGEDIVPTDANGGTFDHIPGTFVGSENNDPEIDDAPLYPIATLNEGHYRNSADYEESVFIAGQPTPWASGLTEEWAEKFFGNHVQLGSRAFIPLPEGGNTGLLQAEANSLPMEAMKHKEEQMVSIGAKIVEQKAVQKTATEAGYDEASETSTLATIADNVSTAYTTMFGDIYQYLGLEFDPSTTFYELNKDFEIATLSAQDQQALMSTWMAGGILDEEMRERLQKAGLASIPFNDWKQRVGDDILNKSAVGGGGVIDDNGTE